MAEAAAGELTNYGRYVAGLLKRQEEIIAKVGTKKEKEAIEPPVTLLGYKAMPVEVKTLEGPGGSKIVEMKRCGETHLEKEGVESTNTICHKVSHLIDAKSLKCTRELPGVLLDRLEPKPPRLPTSREAVRAALICNESMNEKLLSALTGLSEGAVRPAIKELTSEGVIETPPPKEIFVEVSLEPAEVSEFEEEPEAPRKVAEKVTHTGLDPLGLRLYQIKFKERDRIKQELCPSPCLVDNWWGGKK